MPPRKNRVKRKEQISFQLVLDENGETVLRPLTFPKSVRNKKDLQKFLPEDFPMELVEEGRNEETGEYKQQTIFSREGDDGGLSAEDRRLLDKFKNMSLGELGFDDNGDLLEGNGDDFDPSMFDDVDENDTEVIDLNSPENALEERNARRNQKLFQSKQQQQQHGDDDEPQYDDLSKLYSYDYNKHFRPITGLGTFLTPNDGVVELDPTKLEPIIPAMPENDAEYEEDLKKDEQVKKRQEFISTKVKATVVSAASGLELPVFEGNDKYNELTEDFLAPLETGDTELYEEIEDNIFELLLQSSDDEGDDNGNNNNKNKGMSRNDVLKALESGSLFNDAGDDDELADSVKKPTTKQTTSQQQAKQKRGSDLGAWSDEEEEIEERGYDDSQDFGFGSDDDPFARGYDDANDDDDRDYNYDDYDDDAVDDDDIVDEVNIMIDAEDLENEDDAIGAAYFAAIKQRQRLTEEKQKEYKKTGRFDEETGEFIDPDDLGDSLADGTKVTDELLHFQHVLNTYEDSEEDDYDTVDTMGGKKTAEKKLKQQQREEQKAEAAKARAAMKAAVQFAPGVLPSDDEEEDEDDYYGEDDNQQEEDEDDYYGDDDDEDDDYYDKDDGPMFTINTHGVDITDGDVKQAIHEFVHGKSKRIKEAARPDLIPDEIVQATKRMILEQQCEPQPSLKQVQKEIDRFFAKKKKDVSDIRTIKTTMSTVSNIPTTIKETRLKTVKATASKSKQKEILKKAIKNPYDQHKNKPKPQSIFEREQVGQIKLGETGIAIGVLAKHRQEREQLRKEREELKKLDAEANAEINTLNNTLANQPKSYSRKDIIKKAQQQDAGDDDEEFTSAATAKKSARFDDEHLEVATEIKNVDEIQIKQPATSAADSGAPKRKLLFSLPTEVKTVEYGFVKTHEIIYDDSDDENKKKHVDKYAHKKAGNNNNADEDLYANVDLSKYVDEPDQDEDEDDEEFDPDALYIPGMARRRGETKEERKARKEAVKMERQERRQQKKKTKELYKAAEKHQKQQEIVNKFHNPAHKRLM